MNKIEKKIGIIGLGYVGLPLSVAFAEKYKVIGFDINSLRINELNSGHDSTLEIQDDFLKSVLDTDNFKEIGLHITTKKEILNDCNVYIVTVPTPTDKHNRPVLFPLIKASETIAEFLKKGDIVIYESTVYPGVTEDEMVPVLEKISGLVYNVDFFCGYSPERINPGDKEHTVTNILKVTSGSTPEIANVIDELYKSVITAGTFKASSIKVAEAAKVIENSQRDINIAFVNELSKIFNLIGIDTHEVLEAASTKWNFINFKPGLVGGHCIGVDPYYLTHKAESLGYNPEIILAGRRMNDGMASFVSSQLIKLLAQQNIKINQSKILILGLSFKEDCPDIRNTKVVDIISELQEFNCKVSVYDPWVDKFSAKKEYDIALVDKLETNKYDGIIIAVAHKQFKKLGIKKIKSFGKTKHVIYDLKYLFSQTQVEKRL